MNSTMINQSSLSYSSYYVVMSLLNGAHKSHLLIIGIVFEIVQEEIMLCFIFICFLEKFLDEDCDVTGSSISLKIFGRDIRDASLGVQGFEEGIVFGWSSI